MDNNNTQNSSGMMNGMPPSNMVNGNKPEKKIGPIVGSLIIVLVLIVAALYFFGQKLNTQTPPADVTTPGTVISTTSDSMNNATGTQVESNAALKSDLDNQLKNVDYSF